MTNESKNPNILLSSLAEGFEDPKMNDTIRTIENSLNAISDILRDIDTRLKALE